MAECEQMSMCFDDVLKFFVLILDRSSFLEKHVLENSRRVDHVSIDHRRYCQANHSTEPTQSRIDPSFNIIAAHDGMTKEQPKNKTHNTINKQHHDHQEFLSHIPVFFFVYFSPLPVCCLFSISHLHNTIHQQASPDRMEWNFFSKSCISAVKSRRRRCRRFH